jgi:hypothetical protein
VNIRIVPRSAVDGYLRLVRFPLDGAIGLLPGNGTGAKPAAELVLDRLDAALRAALARILSDPVLREDAAQRRSAADQRERALGLRVDAERRAEAADTRLEERQEQATRQREQATQRASVRRQQAAREVEKEKQRAAKTERDRLEASRWAAELDEEALNDREAHERLQTVNARTDALREKEKELTVRDEARRLREAASGTKTKRKAG